MPLVNRQAAIQGNLQLRQCLFYCSVSRFAIVCNSESKQEKQMIKLSDYRERLHLVEVEFRFIRFALESLKPSRKALFFRDLSNERVKRFKTNLQMMELPPEVAAYTDKIGTTGIKARLEPRNRRRYMETIEDGVNGSELLVRVALFEAFMQEIHAEALRAKPALLAALHPDRELKYKDVFHDSATSSTILEHAIHREVREVDQMGFLNRAKYFENNLQLPLGDQAALSFVSEIMNTRNEISHKNPLTTVSPELLWRAVAEMSLIPEKCFGQAQQRFGKQHYG
jgi:hypothetical protein